MVNDRSTGLLVSSSKLFHEIHDELSINITKIAKETEALVKLLQGLEQGIGSLLPNLGIVTLKILHQVTNLIGGDDIHDVSILPNFLVFWIKGFDRLIQFAQAILQVMHLFQQTDEGHFINNNPFVAHPHFTLPAFIFLVLPLQIRSLLLQICQYRRRTVIWIHWNRWLLSVSLCRYIAQRVRIILEADAQLWPCPTSGLSLRILVLTIERVFGLGATVGVGKTRFLKPFAGLD